MPRAVARGEDVRIRGAAELIDDDAVLAFETGVARQRVGAHDTDGDEHEVRGDVATIGKAHRRHALRAHGRLVRRDGSGNRIGSDQRHDAYAAQHLHAVTRMLALIELRDDRGHHPVHHPIRGFEDGDLEPRLAAGGRDFEADVSATDDHGAPSRRELAPQSIHVGDPAQVMDAGEFRSRQRQAARVTADGQQQPVVLDRAAVGDLDAASLTVDTHCRKPEPHVHGVIRVVRGMPDEQPVALERSREEFL